jgi:cytochrome c553
MHEFTECTTCHGNHGIVRPNLSMFSSLPETPCGFCHGDFGLAPETTAEPRKAENNFKAALSGLLETAEAKGLTDQDRFDWLIDQAQQLPQHSIVGSGGETPTLRPEFAKLFDKFRLGKSYFTYQDVDTGEPVRVDLVRCGSCHSPEAEADSAGARTGAELIRRMAELTATTARAERILLAARRGGVETREALNEIDQAVAAQIGLEVLVHGFTSEAGSDFSDRHLEGLEHANAALAKGQDALDELGYRRKGLVVALVIIAAVLFGLALKIRALAGSS